MNGAEIHFKSLTNEHYFLLQRPNGRRRVFVALIPYLHVRFRPDGRRLKQRPVGRRTVFLLLTPYLQRCFIDLNTVFTGKIFTGRIGRSEKFE